MPPNGYSDDDLAALAASPESDLVERKRSLSNSSATKILRSICAFANDLSGHGKPGVILVGVEDDGSCAGTTIDDALLKRLADMRDHGELLPRPSMDVQRRTLDGCEVAVVTVQPSNHPPVRYEGRVWVRIGPTVRSATASDEQRLAERRRYLDAPFDLRPAHGASIDDLDIDHIRRRYLPCAVSAEVLAENQRPLEDQLRSLRLMSGDTPTNGAMLAFGREAQHWLPESWVQFVRFDGDDVTDPPRNSQALTGRIEDILGDLSRLVRLNVSTRLDIASGDREQRFPDYPVEALLQLAYNAVMHRSYEGTHSPSRLYWYSERVEIESPGGLFGAVTPETLLKGATAYRNQLIAEIMANLGFAQRFGYGIPSAVRALRSNDNPEPEFQVEDSRIRVIVRAARR
ncbi:MAG: putative DNA binding domain-containing protein [Acidimicrobiaceae bacterium]|nr:putative DNA binding domain-containing protein [Acidimicrobiaceae bacterium]